MAQQMTAHTHYRSCTLCEAMCGIAIEHDDRSILSIRGDTEDPFSQGYICAKATALKDIHEDPDRLRKPLERYKGGWREISWEQAYDKAAAGIRAVQKRHGRHAVATYMGNPNVHNLGAMLYSNNLHAALKTRHRYSATSVDQLPHHIVSYHLFGHQMKLPVPDIDRCSHFLIFGANPLASNGSIMTAPNIKQRLKHIMASGGKVIVLDPRRTETAALASEHHFVRPGSDVLVLLAMIHVLYREGWVRPGHLQAMLSGADDIESRVAAYSPERVAMHTGLSAETLEQLVADFVAADAPVCYGRMGVSVQRFGLLSQYLIMLFNILTGRLDVPGGMMFTEPVIDLTRVMGPGHLGRNHTRLRGLPEFSGEFPVSSLAEEIATPGEGQVRALITLAGNPALSTPNGPQLEQALDGLEFMVAIDFYLNETTRHANIILPPVSPLERDHYDVAFHALSVRNTAKYSPALFAPPASGRHDWQIISALVERLSSAGLRQKVFSTLLLERGPVALLGFMMATGSYGKLKVLGRMTVSRLLASPHGIDLGPLRPRLPDYLHHNDRKIHLRPDFYWPDLERVEAHFFAQQQGQENELLLIGRRHVRDCNSWLHNSYRLMKGKSRCTLMMHPDDAARRGIDDNAEVTVRSRTGVVRITASLSTDIMPGVVSMPHGYGHDRKGSQQTLASKFAGVSINDISDELLVDELSGNAALNGVPVSVVPLAATEQGL